jgi:hypothetical protein
MPAVTIKSIRSSIDVVSPNKDEESRFGADLLHKLDPLVVG